MMPRPAANAVTSIFQPWPMRSWPPMIQSMGTNTSLAPVGTVGKGLHAGVVPPADLHAGRVGRYEGKGDAEVFLIAQNVVRVSQLEGDGRARCRWDRAKCSAWPS